MTKLSNNCKRLILSTLLGGAVIAQSGCLLAAAGACAGAGAYVYYRGAVSDTYGAEFGEVYQGSKEALGDMAMPVISEHHDGLTGTIESSMSDGTRVTITLEEKPRMKPEDGHTTEVGVRIGVLGDEKLSTEMMQKISARVTQRMRSGPVPAATAGRTGDRLPPLPTTPAVQPAAAVQPAVLQTTNPNNGGWKPAQPSNGEPPKPP